MKRMVGVFCLLLAALGQATAGELVVSPEVSLTYSDPAGYCLIDPARSSGEKSLFDLTLSAMGPNTTVRLELLLIDCQTLRALQTTGAAEPTTFSAIAYAIEIRDGQPYRSSDSRADFVDARAKLLKKNLLAAIEASAKQRNIDPKDVKDQVVDDSDPDAFVVGVSIHDATHGEIDGEIGVTFAVTLVKGYGILPLSLRTPLDPAGLSPQVAEVRALAHDLIALNDPEGAGSGECGILGFFGKPVVKVLLYLLIGASVALIYLRQRRKKMRAKADHG